MMKLYGPYTRKDGRQHVILIDGRKRRTVSYPKFLMEQHLGRELGPDETVDHIDRDFTNNALTNLCVKPRSEHASEDNIRVRDVEFHCVWCGRKGRRRAARIDRNARLGKAGPFCSKRCSGQYSTSSRKLPPQTRIPVEDREYFYVTKPGAIRELV